MVDANKKRHEDSETRRSTRVVISLSPSLRASLSASEISNKHRYLNKSSVPPLSSAFGFSSFFGFAGSDPKGSFDEDFSVAGAGGAGGFAASAAGGAGFSSVAPNPGGGATLAAPVAVVGAFVAPEYLSC